MQSELFKYKKRAGKLENSDKKLSERNLALEDGKQF
jgi:hypothetical protein